MHYEVLYEQVPHGTTKTSTLIVDISQCNCIFLLADELPKFLGLGYLPVPFKN